MVYGNFLKGMKLFLWHMTSLNFFHLLVKDITDLVISVGCQKILFLNLYLKVFVRRYLAFGST